MVYPFPFVPGNILTAAELNALQTAIATPSLGMSSGSYFNLNAGNAATGTQTNQLCHYSPFFVPAQRAFDRIATYSFAGAGTNNIRLGIYNNDTTTGKPSTVNLDAGTVAVTAVGLFTITISKTLAAGWYWLAFCPQGGGGTRTFGSGQNIWGSYPYDKDATLNSNIYGFTQAGVAGAFATAVPVATTGIMPFPALRAT